MSIVQDDRLRFATMAEDYDRMAPYLVPQYEFLQEEMIRQTQVLTLVGPRVVDLGAGSGRCVEKILDGNPQAVCFWVDSSPAFLNIARRRLGRFGDRVEFVLSALEDDWEAQVGGAVDCIFSMSAIHHLEHGQKYTLYERCFDLLRPGGWFINTDEAKTLFPDAYLASLHYWARHVDNSAPSVPDGLRGHCDRWRAHFARWKQRNIDGIDAPKTKGDDMHEVFTDQVKWLHEIGFECADVFVKYQLWCMMGGRKPSGRSQSGV